jgi:hypothetical protein
MRDFTRRMLELNDEGMFDKDMLIQDLLTYLSEDEVKDFVRRSDFFGFEDLGFRSSCSEPEDEEDYEYYNRLEAERDVYGDNATESDFA